MTTLHPYQQHLMANAAYDIRGILAIHKLTQFYSLTVPDLTRKDIYQLILDNQLVSTQPTRTIDKARYKQPHYTPTDYIPYTLHRLYNLIRYIAGAGNHTHTQLYYLPSILNYLLKTYSLETILKEDTIICTKDLYNQLIELLTDAKPCNKPTILRGLLQKIPSTSSTIKELKIEKPIKTNAFNINTTHKNNIIKHINKILSPDTYVLTANMPFGGQPTNENYLIRVKDKTLYDATYKSIFKIIHKFWLKNSRINIRYYHQSNLEL